MEVPRKLNSERLFAARCLEKGFVQTPLSDRIHGKVLPRRGCGPGQGFTCAGHVPLYGPFFCCEFSARTKAAIGEVFPEVRLSKFNLRTHNLMKQSLIRLKQEELPRDKVSGNYLFPSSPTFLERLEMIRAEQQPRGRTREYGSYCRVSRNAFNENARLVKRLVGHRVYGLRSDVKVPAKWLGHFRYCNGFSILTAPRAMPIGLARFLASIWCIDPHSLWLERLETLKQSLREVPIRFLESVDDLSDFSFESDSDEE